MRFLFSGLLILILYQFAARQEVSATIVVSLTLEGLTCQADLIVLGSCEETTSACDSERKRRKKIFTYITIWPEQCLKGNECSSRLRIRQLGGSRVDDIAMRITGTPKFNTNERVIVFLKKVSPFYYRIIGLSQGKFRVIHHGDNLYVQRDLNGLKLLKKSSKNFCIIDQSQPESKAQLNHFIQKIKSYVSER